MKSKAVRDELEQIRTSKGGVLRASDVVEFAKANKKSALHGCFEWDRAKAAGEYWLWQARRVIAVNVHVVSQNTAPVRTYVSLKGDRKGKDPVYRKIDDVLVVPQQRAELLDQARHELEQWQTKYRHLEELAAIFAALDDAAA